MGLLQAVVKTFLVFVLNIFFREAKGLNVHKLPKTDPVIFVCAPHANQFLDPVMVIKTCGRDVGFLAAAVSMKRKFVGAMARAMRSIPVARPQDVAAKGIGTVSGSGTRLTGEGTLFTKELEADFTVNAGGKSVVVVKVISDTEAILKEPGFKEDIAGVGFKIIPKLDQSEVYDTVYEELRRDECIGIFPEGGSHDRTELLPLKAGFTIMALGALVKYPDLRLKIVPVGLNYYRAHAFRSLAYVDYGAPIEIPPELVEKYKQGGASKREACAALLDMVVEGMKLVTVTAPDYETLQLFQGARRLYKPAGLKLSPQKKLALNRAFAQGYERCKDLPEVQKFKNDLSEYLDNLRHFGIEDHQVKRIPDYNRCYAFVLLLARFLMFLVLAILTIPGIILLLPVWIATTTVPKKKAKEAKAASSVKIAGRDVLATWKVFVGLGLVPFLWLGYTAAVAALIPIFAVSLPLWAKIVIPVGTFLVIPFMFHGTVIFVERGRNIFLSLKPLFLASFSRRTGKDLKNQREELRTNLRTLVEILGPQLFEDFDRSRVIGKDEFADQLFTNPLNSLSGGLAKSDEEDEQGEEAVPEEVNTDTRVLITNGQQGGSMELSHKTGAQDQ